MFSDFTWRSIPVRGVRIKSYGQRLTFNLFHMLMRMLVWHITVNLFHVLMRMLVLIRRAQPRSVGASSVHQHCPWSTGASHQLLLLPTQWRQLQTTCQTSARRQPTGYRPWVVSQLFLCQLSSAYISVAHWLCVFAFTFVLYIYIYMYTSLFTSKDNIINLTKLN